MFTCQLIFAANINEQISMRSHPFGGHAYGVLRTEQACTIAMPAEIRHDHRPYFRRYPRWLSKCLYFAPWTIVQRSNTVVGQESQPNILPHGRASYGPVQSEPCSNVVAHHVDAMPSTLTKQRRSDRLPEDSPKPMGQDATNHPLIYQTSSLDPQTFSWPVQPYSRFLLEL